METLIAIGEVARPIIFWGGILLSGFSLVIMSKTR